MNDGNPLVVEYSELPDYMAELRSEDKLVYRAGSIANHFFTLDFLKTISSIDLPYHIARKKVPYFDNDTGKQVKPTKENGIKLERFIFDVFPESRYDQIIQSL
jgi:UDP-N-acetylglucosamine/UDP-N-acetylgalactosamine diphosphorylase